MTWLDIKDWFKREVGESGYVMLYETNGKPNGIATIEVSFPRICDEAVEKLNGLELNGRKIICRRETPRDQEKVSRFDVIGGRKRSPSPPRRDRYPPPLCRMVTPFMLEQAGFQGPITDSVYVNNLKFDVKWQHLKDLFRRAGNVIKADVALDKDGKSRGFATVRFDQPFEALIAVAMFHNETMQGREMRVRMDREGALADPHRPLFPANHSRAASEFLAQMTRRVHCNDRDEARIAANVCDLMVRGPPPPPHIRPPIMPGPVRDTYSPGLQSNKAHLCSPGDRPYGMRQRSPEPAGRLSDSASINLLRAAIAGGMPPGQVEQYAAQLGVPPPELARIRDSSRPAEQQEPSSSTGNRVMVRNIPMAFTDRDLEHYFAGFGQLKDARICVDANRRSLGYGFVEYFSIPDAKQACSRMNGYTIDGQPMRVAFN